MMEVSLTPISNLDRKVPIERHFDDLLKRYSTPRFNTFDAVASYRHLVETYLQVARRRSKLRGVKSKPSVIAGEQLWLALITQDTQDEVSRQLQLARKHLLQGELNEEQAKALVVLERLEQDMPNLSNGDQRVIGTTIRPPSKMKAILIRLLKRNPEITSPEVIEALRDMKGDGVVLAIDDEYVEIDVTAHGSKVRKTKPYKLTAMPSLLSRTKNPRHQSTLS